VLCRWVNSSRLSNNRIAVIFRAMHYKKNDVRGYLTNDITSHPRIPERDVILTPFLQTQEVLSCVFESVPSKVHSCTNNLIHCFHGERTERARGAKGIKEREQGVICASVPMEKHIVVLESVCRSYRQTDVPDTYNTFTNYRIKLRSEFTTHISCTKPTDSVTEHRTQAAI